MKRYITTEEKLVQYREALEEFFRTGKDYLKVEKASMACRKDEFPEWVTHIAEIDSRLVEPVLRRYQPISFVKEPQQPDDWKRQFIE